MQPYRQPSADELQGLLDRATGGAYPQWRNNEWYDDDRCVAVASTGHQEVRCRVRATVHVWFGCVHEHVNRSGVCGMHADLLEGYRGGWRCQACYDRTGEIVLARFIRREPISPEPPDDDEDVMIG